MKTTARIVGISLLLFICGRCDMGTKEKVPSIHMTKKAAQLVNVNNQFGLELFHKFDVC